MTDNNDKMIADFFKQAAQQQIEDNGFTEQVMQSLPDRQIDVAHKLSRLWTWFCIVIGAVLFFLLGGWQMLKDAFISVIHMSLTWLEVFLTTAPTTEIPLNPVAVLLFVAFVLIYLPYRTYHRLSATL